MFPYIHHSKSTFSNFLEGVITGGSHQPQYSNVSSDSFKCFLPRVSQYKITFCTLCTGLSRDVKGEKWFYMLACILWGTCELRDPWYKFVKVGAAEFSYSRKNIVRDCYLL